MTELLDTILKADLKMIEELSLSMENNLEIIERKVHVKREVKVKKTIGEIEISDININNAFDLLYYINGQIAKRNFTIELEDSVNKLKSFVNRIEKIRNFKHIKAHKLIGDANSIFDDYEYFKVNRKVEITVRKRITMFNLTDKDINVMSDLVQESKNKSVVFKKQEFLKKFRMTEEHIPYFKNMIRGRFRLYEFVHKKEKYIELHDFLIFSEIAKSLHDGENKWSLFSSYSR